MKTKRQVLLEYGFNFKTFGALISEGLVEVEVRQGKRCSVFVEEASLLQLVEGEHFVVCLNCGARQFQMTTKHLKKCGKMSLAEYQETFPQAPLIGAWSAKRKLKTEAQKTAQSLKLTARFQTLEGEITRQEISAASKKLHASGYREKAVEHLRALNRDPAQRLLLKGETQKRWAAGGDLRAAVPKWHKSNPDRSRAAIAHARKFLSRTSKLHLRFKQRMLEVGLEGFETEHPLGWYSVDEAHERLRIAVEVDGCYWHGCETCGFSGTSRVRRIDKSKTSYLENRGWKVLRFPEHQLKSDLEGCLKQLALVVQEREGV